MDNVLLPQKAKAYTRHITLQTLDNCQKMNQGSIYDASFSLYDKRTNKSGVRNKKSALVMIVVLLTLLATIFLLSSQNEMANTMQNVVYDFFVPKDLGRIKFVDNSDYEEEAFGFAIDFGVPFVCSVGQNYGETFVFKSGGEITIKCAADGVVEDVIISSDGNFTKTVIVSHPNKIKSEYYMLDTVAVKKGDRVQKNTVLGLNQNGEVGLKFTYNGKTIRGLKIVDGELVFD